MRTADRPSRLPRLPSPSRGIQLLPNFLTIANATLGFLAISKGVDALALSRDNPDVFFLKMETACWLVVAAGVLDALDGKLARLTKSAGEFGGQLDSFADFLTFGCAPAILAKVLIEHQGPALGYHGFPRLHFVAAAVFAIMALLRLVRFNVENDPDPEAHRAFSGLPSPAAAGTVIATILLILSMCQPALEQVEGTRTPMGGALALLSEGFPEFSRVLPAILLPALVPILIGLGLLMVSRVPYAHVSFLTQRGRFTTLIYLVLIALALLVAPVPFLFALGYGYVGWGLVRHLRRRRHAA